MKTNYSAITDNIIEKNKAENIKPSLLLHVCCAPCASYVIEYLHAFFNITLYYYNPNIYPHNEYLYRLNELKRLVLEMPEAKGINIISGEYEPDEFIKLSKGLENINEGGERCKKCYFQRMEKSANLAREQGFDFFATTLTISPHKNAEWINEIGDILSQKYGINYLFSDFKKKNGYKRSIELSNQYNLYRQDFCGCPYSKTQAERRRLEKREE